MPGTPCLAQGMPLFLALGALSHQDGWGKGLGLGVSLGGRGKKGAAKRGLGHRCRPGGRGQGRGGDPQGEPGEGEGEGGGGGPRAPIAEPHQNRPEHRQSEMHATEWPSHGFGPTLCLRGDGRDQRKNGSGEI